MKIAGTALAMATFLLLVVALGDTGANLLGALETDLNPVGQAYELNQDASGNLIVSEYGAGEVWQVNPATNVYTVYNGITSATEAKVDSAGNVWWTAVDMVGRYSISNDSVTEWFFENAIDLKGLAIDSADRIWVEDNFYQELWRIDITNTQLCTYTFNTRSDYIIHDSGDLWLSDWANDRIFRLDTLTDSYDRWQLPSSNPSSFPGGLTLDGDNKLWWADHGLDALASLDPATDLLTTYPLPMGSDPQMVTTGNDGIWYSEQGDGTVGRLDPATAVGITSTLTVGNFSTTPVCGFLADGVHSSPPLPTGGVASWTGVTLDLLMDANGWQIFDLPPGGLPWGISNLNDKTYVVDQGRQKLMVIESQAGDPTITLIKDPTNDDGGNAAPDDFDLTVGGAPVDSGEPFTVTAGTSYAINETVVDGYTFVSVTGSAKCPAALGGQITPNAGENVICTITNDDIAPTITLIKHVIWRRCELECSLHCHSKHRLCYRRDDYGWLRLCFDYRRCEMPVLIGG
jgi:streptogramin lyase